MVCTVQSGVMWVGAKATLHLKVQIYFDYKRSKVHTRTERKSFRPASTQHTQETKPYDKSFYFWRVECLYFWRVECLYFCPITPPA